MRKKGFTLVELLVVIAIIALLMGILMPALARVRQIAYRMVCGTNLSGIGKAMLIYANDYDDELPRAGPVGATLGPLNNWRADTRADAFSGGKATTTSCFYLLVKFAEVTPKSFICKGDSGVTEFKFTATAPDDPPRPDFELIDAWDFGGTQGTHTPSNHCSYSYHHPFSLYALTTSSESGMAIAADRNPWFNSPGATAKDIGAFKPDRAPWNGTTDEAKYGNAIAHQEDGQNVLFIDTHVTFEKRAYCGVNDDNIYTAWDSSPPTEDDRFIGNPGKNQPNGRLDSFLINNEAGGGAGPPPPG